MTERNISSFGNNDLHPPLMTNNAPKLNICSGPFCVRILDGPNNCEGSLGVEFNNTPNPAVHFKEHLCGEKLHRENEQIKMPCRICGQIFVVVFPPGGTADSGEKKCPLIFKQAGKIKHSRLIQEGKLSQNLKSVSEGSNEY